MQLLRILAISLQLSAIHSFAQPSSNKNHQLPRSSSTCQATSNSNMVSVSTKLRSVKKVLPRPSPHWVGDGFFVYPVFSSLAFTKELSPLLMFDYAEPKKFPAKVGPPKGVGQHPHRGFETITIAFQGEVEHKDSTGKQGVIGPGDVQWMTAARGIIHEEYHSKEFTKTGGTFEMAQLWVNLPKKYKMSKPRYQPILNKQIPVVNLPLTNKSTSHDEQPVEPLATARIIAGELGETKGAAQTFSPVQLWDINLPHAGSEIDLPFPAEHNCIVFVRRGSVDVLSGSGGGGDDDDNNNNNNNKLQSTTLKPQEVALMRMDGSDVLRVRVKEPDSSILILGGEPLDEPIAAHGPFVMNTQDEIHQAISDYRTGKMGR